jgi:hypothetical protein
MPAAISQSCVVITYFPIQHGLVRFSERNEVLTSDPWGPRGDVKLVESGWHSFITCLLAFALGSSTFPANNVTFYTGVTREIQTNPAVGAKQASSSSVFTDTHKHTQVDFGFVFEYWQTHQDMGSILQYTNCHQGKSIYCLQLHFISVLHNLFYPVSLFLDVLSFIC